MQIFINIISLIRRKLFIPTNDLLIVLVFFLRKFFLGSNNAILYFSRVDKNIVIQLLRLNGATIGENCDIESGLIFHNCNNFNNLTIGNNCHIGKNCFFDLRAKVTIEDNVVISMLSTFITHQDINKSKLRHLYSSNYKDIIIKSNSYIGVRSTILQGVVVNEFSIIAAGSIVLKSIEPYTIVGGVPAKFIKNIEKNEL